MFYLITGGSGSGKSEYAENLARKLGKSTAPDTEAAPLYYIATMRVWDEEGRARVRRSWSFRRRRASYFWNVCPT